MTQVDCGVCEGYCCRNHRVALCPLDLERLRKATTLNPADFITLESVDDMYSMFSDLLIKGRYYLTLRRFRDGACIFAEKKEGARLKCSIYENRPLACRLYPLKLTVDGRVAKRGKINCPAVFDKKKVNEEVKRLQEMIQHEIQSFEKKAYAWNRSGGGTLEECLKGLC